MNYVKTEAETVFMNHDPDILPLVFYLSDYFSQAELRVTEKNPSVIRRFKQNKKICESTIYLLPNSMN